MPHTISGQATRERRIGGVVRAIVAFFAAAATLSAQSAPMLPAETLLDRAVLKALDEELSGVAAKDHVARLTQLHRVPASPGFHDAIDFVMGRARALGLSDVHVETFSGEHSDDVTYEVVNFIDGTRTVAEIRDAVSAKFE